jgi:DNA-3-methyladenine glycosylase II
MAMLLKCAIALTFPVGATVGRCLHAAGRWSAEYTLLRGLGRLHVFPGDDVGERKNLARWLGLAEPLDYAGVQHAVAGWHPFAGFVYFHLLLDRLAARGDLEGPARVE